MPTPGGARAALVARSSPGACGVTTMVRGAHGTPEAGTRTQYVPYVGPWRQAALCLWYVQYAGQAGGCWCA